MKTLLLAVIFAGSIVLYLMGAAFHIDNFEQEMLIHNAVIFIAGFVFFGIWFWYKRKLKFKAAIYCVLTLLALDFVIDYFRDIDHVSLELFIHDSFVVVWGTLLGFLYMRKNHQRSNH